MPSFKSYRYDPSDPGTPAKVKADIPEFNFKCPDINKLIIYTIFVYDPHADLLGLFPNDFNRRKYEAALKAGFTLDDRKFDQWVEDCMLGANENYNNAVVEFVTRFNIADLPTYVMFRDIFFSEIRTAMSATDSKAKKDAMMNVEMARQKVSELEKKLFTDEETINARSALYIMAEKMKLNLRPEEKAKEIETKTLKVKDPYYPKRGRPRNA